MAVNNNKTGVGCKWAGLWLLATAVILVYGETAPIIKEPDFTAALICLGAGMVVYYFGCICCARSKVAQKQQREPM